MPRALIIGAGCTTAHTLLHTAVGSVLGWLLARTAPYRVSVVCKSNFAHVQEHGFRLRTTTWGDGLFTPHRVFEAGSALQRPSGAGYAYIILANKIKTEQSRSQMVHDLQHITTPNTILVSTQNGLGNEAALRDAFPSNVIISMVCNLVCCQLSPGVIEQRTSIKPHAFHVGVYGRISQSDFTADESKAVESLLACDKQFVAVDNALLEKWQKAVFNNAWNSMTALTGVDTHELFESPAALELVRHLAEEARQIGIASGVELGGMVPDKVIEIARSCDPIVTSMLYDARRGRALELAPITGFLVAQAARVGIPAPYTTDVYRQLKQMNASLRA